MNLRVRLGVTAVAVTLPMVVGLLWFDAVERRRDAERNLTASVAARGPALRARCEAAPASWHEVLPPSAGPEPHHEGSRPRERRPGGRPEAHGPPQGHGRPDDRSPPDEHRERPAHEPRNRPLDQGRSQSEDRQGPRSRPAEAYAYDQDFRSENPAAPVLSAALTEAIEGRDIAVTPFVWPGPEIELLLRISRSPGPCAFLLVRDSIDPAQSTIRPVSALWLLPMVVVLASVLLSMGPVVRRLRTLTEAARRSASTSYASAVELDGNDEIGELSRAFDAAGREIRARLQEKERRERALRHFLSNTTHDVMIPLTVLQGHLSTLRERAAEGRPVDAAVVISAMDEAHYLASLVNNLSTAARLEVAELHLQRSAVDLNELVQRVIGRHRPIARELGVSLDNAVPERPTVVLADVTLIEQAVSNVTYNAIRYNRAEGHVAVILEEAAPDRFCLRVIDDGPGISEADLAKLLVRGERGREARTRAPDGQGLGLHIAHRAAELHGFRLSLQPSEYGGLEVKLEGEIGRP
jgi:two-component system, OmpR family, sensor histidine kinase BaeS